MFKSFMVKHLTLILAGVAFVVVVLLTKSSSLNLNLIASPIPSPSQAPSPAPTTTPAPSSPVSAVATPTTSVTGPSITSPNSNAKVASPLTVTGVVPAGWMFEGSFPIKLVDKQKKVIASGVGKEVTAGSWQSGQPVSFTATLTFETDAKSGFLILEKDNPSGLPENNTSYQIPVKF